MMNLKKLFFVLSYSCFLSLSACTIDLNGNKSVSHSSLASPQENKLMDQCKNGDQSACTEIKKRDKASDAKEQELLRTAQLGNYKNDPYAATRPAATPTP